MHNEKGVILGIYPLSFLIKKWYNVIVQKVCIKIYALRFLGGVF